MRRRSTLIALLPGLFLLGCSVGKGSAAPADTGGTSAGGATSGSGGEGSPQDGSDTGTDTAAPLPPPVWFTMAADLTITGGELTEIAFNILVWGEDTTAPMSCKSERLPLRFTQLEITPDVQIYRWWSIETDPESSDCEGAQSLPTMFYFGLGAIDVELLPALSQAGLEETGGIYGAYASLPNTSAPFCGGTSASACVYGYAATPAGFAGEIDPEAAEVLPDGHYATVTAWFFPTD